MSDAIGRSAGGATVAAGALAGVAAAGLGWPGVTGTRADRVTARFAISGLGENVGAAGRAGATVGFWIGLAMGLETGLIAAGFALIATTLFFAGAAAFFFAGFGALRRAAAARAFLRAGLRALLARFFPAFLRFAAGLARRALLRFFAAMVVSPTW